MDSKVVDYTIQMDVHAGKMDEFQAIAARATAETLERDPGCLMYEWSVFGDSVQLHERFSDEAAWMAHIDWAEPTFGELLALSTLASFDIHATDLGPATTAKAAEFGAKIYAPTGGFAR